MKTKRRSILKSMFATSVALTLGARVSMECVVGATSAPKIPRTHKIVEVNEDYLAAAWEESFSVFHGSSVLQTLIANTNKGRTVVGAEELPRRYRTFEDAEAGRNPVPPYLFVDIFEDGTPVYPGERANGPWFSEEEMEEYEDAKWAAEKQDYLKARQEEFDQITERFGLKWAPGCGPKVES
jgi:hypothetical protein